MANLVIKWVPLGITRPPREGEIFKLPDGGYEQAMFDFHATSFPIYKRVMEMYHICPFDTPEKQRSMCPIYQKDKASDYCAFIREGKTDECYSHQWSIDFVPEDWR